MNWIKTDKPSDARLTIPFDECRSHKNSVLAGLNIRKKELSVKQLAGAFEAV